MKFLPTLAALGLMLTSTSMLSAQYERDPIRIKSFDPLKYDVSLVVFPRTAKVVSIDTVTVFDSDTYEETVTVVKSEAPIDAYFEDRNNFLTHKYQNQEAAIVDTVVVFDYETYEETVTIVKRNNPCYSFSWGSNIFSGSHSISTEEAKSLRTTNIKILMVGKDCEKVSSSSYSIVVVPEKKDPMLYAVKSDGKFMVGNRLPEDYFTKGSRIFIENLKINETVKLNSIVISIED